MPEPRTLLEQIREAYRAGFLAGASAQREADINVSSVQRYCSSRWCSPQCHCRSLYPEDKKALRSAPLVTEGI